MLILGLCRSPLNTVMIIFFYFVKLRNFDSNLLLTVAEVKCGDSYPPRRCVWRQLDDHKVGF